MRGLSRRQLLEIGGLIVVLLLPLAFDPFATQPSEAVKVAVLQAITIGMVIAFIFSSPRINANQAESPLRGSGLSLTISSFQDNPLLLPVLIYSVVYILATIFSIDPQQSLWGTITRQGSLTVLCLMLFFILNADALRSSVQVDRLITALIVVSVPVAIYGWLQYFGLDPLEWDTTSLSPVHSTVGYSLFLGAFLAMVIPFTLFKIFGGQADGRYRPFPFVIILVMQVCCLLFTLSRGAWLGLLGACMVFLWLLAYLWQRKRLILLSVLVLGAGSFLFLSMNKGSVLPSFTEQNGLSDASIAQNRKVSDNDRMMIWINTLPMITRRFLFGYGPETFSTAFWLTHPTGSFSEVLNFNPWDPHNIFLYHLTATGVSGLMAFLWILARFYRMTYYALKGAVDRHTGIMVAAIISSATAFLIQAQFNPNGIVPVVLFWIVLAMGVSAFRWIDVPPSNVTSD